MSALGDIRQEIVTALSSITANKYDHLPEMIACPALVILPGSPYVTSEGQPFGHFQASFTLALVANVSVNEVVTAELDAMIGDVITTLVSEGFSVIEVSEPYTYTSNTAAHLAADLSITTTFTF